MNKTETILKLSDDNEYYNGIGKNYISNSDIGTLLRNPRMFRVAQPTTSQLLQGSYFHTLALEPHKAKNFKIVDASTRTTNIYKDACRDNAEDVMLLKGEAWEMEQMVNALRCNRDLAKLVWDNYNQYEVPFIGEIFGLPFKCKVDVWKPQVKLYDLKTTSSLDEFKYSAKKYNYDSQAWIYKELTGLDMEFIAIEKGTNRIGQFMVTDEFLASGERKVVQAIENYNRFFAPDSVEEIDQFYISQYLY